MNEHLLAEAMLSSHLDRELRKHEVCKSCKYYDFWTGCSKPGVPSKKGEPYYTCQRQKKELGET
jgi:hypothetical protein